MPGTRSWRRPRSARLRKPDIKIVVLVTAARSLFDLANDYSIEDLPNNANTAAALEGLTNATACWSGR